MKIAFMILSCTQERYKSMRLKLWEQLKVLPSHIHFFYLFGNSDTPDTTIPEDTRCYKIITPTSDYYEDITKKIYYGFRALYNMGFDYVIKINENIEIVDAHKFFSIICADIPCSDYIALKGIAMSDENPEKGMVTLSFYHYENPKDKRMNYMGALCPYAAGPGYVLSRRSIGILQKEIFETFLYEDITVGFNLRSDNILPLESAVVKEKLIVDTDANKFETPFKYDTYVRGNIPPIIIIPHKKVYINVGGGLGNQLFQIATGLSYALNNNYNLHLIVNNTNERGYFWDNMLSNYKNIITTSVSNAEIYNEPCFSYSQLPIKDNDIHLKGYFQSSKYFSLIKDFFKGSLQFDADLETRIKTKYGSFIFDSNIVLVHARQGDYRRSAEIIRIHNPVDPSYFIKAKVLVEEKVKDPFYVLISDDRDYWNRNPIFTNLVVFDEDTITTFYLMTRLKNFVMSNSTFSWWGVYLADARNVWVPSAWFGPDGPKDYYTIYEPSWNKL
jgi:hypothetical protein